MGYDDRQYGEDIADRLRSVISEAMGALEPGKLNQAVKNTVGSALDEARNQMEQYRERMEDARWRRQTAPGSGGADVKKPLEIRVSWKGKISGILFTVFGSIGTGIFGLTALILLALTLSVRSPAGWWALGICGALTAGFGGMLFKGIGQNRRVGRLRQYISELKRKGRPYCGIEDLSKSCGKKTGFVKKDLRRIIGLGMLPDARMDKDGEWLMLDEETYRQYELFQEARKQQKTEEKFRETVSETANGTEKESEEESEVRKAVRQGEEYMDTLSRLRDALAGEPVREKLDRLDAVLKSLFAALGKHPEQLLELEKFMEYYLPTTVKLVTTYHEFALVEFPGENIKEAKKEIEKTLDTINVAFEKLLDDMYGDAAFDVMTDAAVLQSMLAKEGMTEGDFSLRQ